MSDWVSLETVGFPGYEMSSDGTVRNVSGRVLKSSPNQDGIVRVGLMKREEGRQVTVSLVRLVARMFVSGRSATFDTPIQLDGNRENCDYRNIMWRPRWFAVKYFNQFEKTEDPLFTAKIYDVETTKHYNNSREAAIEHGLLEADILKSVSTGLPCFPTWQQFARASN